MADVKISELPAADALTGDELVPVVQAGATKRATVAALQRIPVNTQTGTVAPSSMFGASTSSAVCAFASSGRPGSGAST